jgi:ATP-binding protein involved in chromosome partitioning
MPTEAEIRTALDRVLDPEIGRPITELGMVEAVEIDGDTVRIGVLLTISGCPMREEITTRVRGAVEPLGVRVEVHLGVMSDEQRAALRQNLRGGQEVREIPFTKPGNLTQILAIASGKGGVGKSSVTANLAAALAARGRSVGILDADVYGHSIPRLLGATAPATQVEGLIMPPVGHGVRVMSVLPMKPGGVAQPVPWRGPMLHKVLEQFLGDVWWGDLDFLLLDLPPGTGDVAISVAQLLPHARLIVVTTPQVAATEVAVRSGMMAAQTKQRVAGVIENMSSFPCPHCGEPIDLFGVGGGALVAEQLTAALGATVPLLGRIPFDVRLREGGDAGEPLVLSDPETPAGSALRDIADHIDSTPRGLVGTPLGITPARR